MSHFSRTSKLNQCFDPWTATPHQKWLWYIDPNTNVVYCQIADTNRSIYQTVLPPLVNTRCTIRQSRTWYRDDIHSPGCPESPGRTSLLPTTIILTLNIDITSFKDLLVPNSPLIRPLVLILLLVLVWNWKC